MKITGNLYCSFLMRIDSVGYLVGKRIVPFCTNGGSEISGSMKGIKASAKVVKGKDLTDLSAKSVKNWAKKKVK